MVAVIAEPITISIETGQPRLMTDAFPLKTCITKELLTELPANMSLNSIMKADDKTGQVIVTLADKHAIYDRVGYTLDGDWICILRIGSP